MKELNEYHERALRTAKRFEETVVPGWKMDLIHAALGIASDGGEFVDAVKKHVIYGKPLDRDNCVEELGDVLWFVALGCEALGVSFKQIARANIEKLAKRYPDKYTDAAAIARADKQEGV